MLDRQGGAVIEVPEGGSESASDEWRRVTCGSCGELLSMCEMSPESMSGPCPVCGRGDRKIDIGVAEEVSVSESVSLAQGPSEWRRDIARRWRETDVLLQEVEQPIATYDHDVVLDRQAKLDDIFVRIQGFREAVTLAGVPAAAAFSEIRRHPDGMALAHDCGNVAKPHAPFDPSRSLTKAEPIFGQPVAERPGSGGAYTFRRPVSQGSGQHDAVHVARRAIEQWERFLKSLNLL